MQAAVLSELRQGLGVGVKDSHKIGGVERNFGGVEHFIRRVREILGGGGLPPPSKSAHVEFVLSLGLGFEFVRCGVRGLGVKSVKLRIKM